MNKFYDDYKVKTGIIDDYMHELLVKYSDCEDILFEAMNYAVFNGGKRIRSVLCVEIARMLTGSIERALPFAAAIEFIHAFSLIHDDLPCMDNADYRRGLPSCHRRYGEAIALLAGDALLNTAFEVMTERCLSGKRGELNAMASVGRATGVHGMINGQIRDIEIMSSGTANEEMLIRLIEQKTMALMMTAVECGAFLSDASEETIKELVKFAYNLGIAFQIRDDFEDEEEDMEDAQNSPNFINTLGRDRAMAKMLEFSSEAGTIIDKYPNNEFLKGLIKFLFER